MSRNFQEFQPLEIWLLGIIALGFTTGVKLPLSRLLLVLCHMALAHSRHADLLGLVVPLAVVASLGPPIAAKIRSMPISALGRGAARLATPAATLAVTLAFAVALVMILPLLMRPIERADDPVTPATAVAAARRIGLSGPVFNSEGFGGYLIFSGIPTFIDGRIELYGNAFLARYLKPAGDDRHALAALLAEYGITWTLLSPGEGAVSQLDTLPGWRRTYTDDSAVIHLRMPRNSTRRPFDGCLGAYPPPKASISESSGNRPSCFFENASRPSTVISNTPATPLTSSTSAPNFSISLALARRALGS